MKRPAPGTSRKKMAKEGSAAEEAGESKGYEAKEDAVMKGVKPGRKAGGKK